MSIQGPNNILQFNTYFQPWLKVKITNRTHENLTQNTLEKIEYKVGQHNSLNIFYTFLDKYRELDHLLLSIKAITAMFLQENSILMLT